MRTKRCYKVAFIVSYPTPNIPTFYQNIALHPRIEITVYYYSKAVLERCADYGIRNEDWGVSLLGKFNYKFLKNFSIWRGRNNPFKFINPQIFIEIKKNCFDAIVLGCWDNVTSWLAILAAKVFGTHIIVMSDSNYIAEQGKPKYKLLIKGLLLGKCLFPIATACLYPGTVVEEFYKLYGVGEDKLFHFPYSIDTDQFLALYQDLKDKKILLRSEMGTPEDAFVILFVGRLHDDDMPMDLLKAFEQVKFEKKTLIFVGDGPLKKDLQDYTCQHNLEHVYSQGFQNREKILRFYASADLFVHPASIEPWGVTVHEAMCFGLPVIATDKVGSAVDFVKHNQNGFVYPCGDIKGLASYIEELAVDKEKRENFGKTSLEIVKNWGRKKASDSLIEALDFIYRDYPERDGD
ncbi:MAG TPA: glycosyltransferase family 4 protein [Candidatus Brocadiia bacterium]|nr:glycosyltransferase family 4 protein [Candidatus Brocadiales bacterium]